MARETIRYFPIATKTGANDPVQSALVENRVNCSEQRGSCAYCPPALYHACLKYWDTTVSYELKAVKLMSTEELSRHLGVFEKIGNGEK